MYPNALQFDSILLRQMDNATLLSYMHQVYDHGQADATMQAKMGQWWTGFGAAYLLFDQVINPSRKSLETEDSPRVKAGGLRLGAWGLAEVVTDCLAGLRKAVLYLLVGELQVLGDVADLHAVVDMEAVDGAAALGQTGQGALHALGQLAGVDYRLGFGGGVGVVFDVVFVLFMDAAAAVVVADGVARQGVDERWQGLRCDEVMAAKQAQEDVLHHVFCFVGIKNAHRDEALQLTAML